MLDTYPYFYSTDEVGLFKNVAVDFSFHRDQFSIIMALNVVNIDLILIIFLLFKNKDPWFLNCTEII